MVSAIPCLACICMVLSIVHHHLLQGPASAGLHLAHFQQGLEKPLVGVEMTGVRAYLGGGSMLIAMGSGVRGGQRKAKFILVGEQTKIM